MGLSALSSAIGLICCGFPMVPLGLAAMLIAILEHRVRLRSPESTLPPKLRVLMVALLILGVFLTCAVWGSWFSGFTA